MFSIGGYHLVNFQQNKYGEYDVYKTELYKGGSRVALVEDTGEGMKVILVSAYNSVRRNEFDYILEDMKELLSYINLDKGALAHKFTQSPYMAAVGFTEFLVELREIVNKYTEGINKADGKYIAVGTMGSSWFSTEDEDKVTEVFYFNTKASKYQTAVKRLT